MLRIILILLAAGIHVRDGAQFQVQEEARASPLANGSHVRSEVQRVLPYGRVQEHQTTVLSDGRAQEVQQASDFAELLDEEGFQELADRRFHQLHKSRELDTALEHALVSKGRRRRRAPAPAPLSIDARRRNPSANTWIPKACYRDTANRALRNGPQKWGYTQDKCMNACPQYKYFALQANGWCCCENDWNHAIKYGRAPGACPPAGGGWVNAVYERIGPKQCDVNNWGAWSSCTKPCAGGTQKRARTVKVAGNGCPGLSESKACNTKPCPIDCQMNAWAPWGKCSKTCGGGQHSRTMSVKTAPAHGGKACPSNAEAKQCNAEACPTTTTTTTTTTSSSTITSFSFLMIPVYYLACVLGTIDPWFQS